MANKNNTPENNMSTAVETIKLLGEHVLELREVIDSQRDELKTLRAEFKNLLEAYKEIDGDFKMFCIDQKDLAKQIKEIKKTTMQVAPAQPKAEAPSYEDIVKRYYPSYAANTEFGKELRSKAIKDKAIKAPVKEDLGFNFARLPRFLNMD